MPNIGEAVIDFGAFPGTSEVQVSVTGQTGILTTSKAEAWVSAVATSDHTINDHAYVSQLIGLSCSAPVAGVGFTIYARCMDNLQGTFNINWVWA